MAIQTRSRTHVIVRVRYDPKSLKQKAEVPLVRPSKQRKTKKGPNPMDENPILRSDIEDPIPIPPFVDICATANFDAPTVFGEQLETGMSAIDHAKRHVEQWEMVKAAHMKHRPHIVQQIIPHIQKAKAHLQALLDDKENLAVNSSVLNLEKRKEKVATRIKLLEDCLATSKFPPEAENIKAAIDGYLSGDIPYSDKYTIIWAGKIVDQAETYGEFMEDRQDRLDRYARKHGPHWLWYESPLNVHPNDAPRASRNTVLPRNVSGNGLGQYWSTQVFCKRAGWVMKLAENIGAVAAHPEQKQFFLERGDGSVYCQDEGPIMAFKTLLDSGATFPSLYETDLQGLGINPRIYAAQTVVALSTANGITWSRIYELFVSVTDDNGESLVDPNNAVWPYHGKYLGGLCPVAVCGEQPTPPDENGYQDNERLSGIMPFLACYVSSTPTRNRLYMGENRKDVIGSQRMPAHRRWDISMSSYQVHDALAYKHYGDPLVTFRHLNGRIVEVDRDDIPHASFTIIDPGTEREYIIQHYPKGACDEYRAGQDVAAAANNPPAFHNVGVHGEDLPS